MAHARLWDHEIAEDTRDFASSTAIAEHDIGAKDFLWIVSCGSNPPAQSQGMKEAADLHALLASQQLVHV